MRNWMKKIISVGLIALALSFSSGCAINQATMMELASFDPITQDIPLIDVEHPPKIHELFIPSHGEVLSGFLLVANGPGPHPTVMLLHGYPGNEKNLDLAQSMRRAGFNVLFFHYRGAWGSSGDYALAHLAEDVAAVLSFVRSEPAKYRIDIDKLSIVGHSMGGFTALRAGARDTDVVCVGGLAAANLGEYAARSAQAKQGFILYSDKLIMLRNFSGAKAMSEIEAHSEEFDVRNDAPGLVGKSVFLITGEQDSAVAPEVQQRIATAYNKQAGLKLHSIIIPGDHSFSSNRIQLQRTVLNWLADDCR